MIISASTDYRAAAVKLPPFLFHIDGGAYAEHTLKRNTADLADIALRQRVLHIICPNSACRPRCSASS